MLQNIIIEEHYRKNKNRLVKVVSRRLGNDQHLSEEAVQESYTRALDFFNCCDFEEKGFNGWFVTILNNVVKDVGRIERDRGLSLDDAEGHGDISVDVDFIEGITSNDIREEIQLYSGGLHREILTLALINGISYSDICKITEATSEKSVKQELYRFKNYMVEKYECLD